MWSQIVFAALLPAIIASPIVARDKMSVPNTPSADAGDMHNNTAMVSDTPRNETAPVSDATDACDCIGNCSGMESSAEQWKCMKTCADTCDGDDDKKKNDVAGGILSGSLLSSLGLRDLDHRGSLPTPAPVHAVNHVPTRAHDPEISSSDEAAYEQCLHSCRTHNCESADIALPVSQCGNTSCEDDCAKFKTSRSGHVKSHKFHHKMPAVRPFRPAPRDLERMPASRLRPASRPTAKTPEVSAGREADYESCMKQCSTHNCQSADIALPVSQCGDTSCEENCAQFKAADFFHAAVNHHLPPVRRAQELSDLPELQDLPNVYKDADVAEVLEVADVADAPEVADVPDVADVPETAAVPEVAAIPNPPNARAVPARQTRPTGPNPHTQPDVSASQHADYESCMSSCKSHNCQSANIALPVSQCGSTSCEQNCAQYKTSAHERIDTTRAATPSHMHVEQQPGLGPVLVPEFRTQTEGAAAAGTEYEDCISKCRTRNCQSADIGTVIEQCGDVRCDENCAHFKSDAQLRVSARMVGGDMEMSPVQAGSPAPAMATAA
ncbi:hypothetical protein GGR54DRAFT_639913 [Hypoxylon sp. NC1633]|nr:hypothetical protein GGR54DRAFT_639913 [Hypoxylon sp. NC1633]